MAFLSSKETDETNFEGFHAGNVRYPTSLQTPPRRIFNVRWKTRKVQQSPPTKKVQGNQAQEQVVMQLQDLVTGVDKGLCNQ